MRRRLVVTDHAGPYALRGGRRLLNLSSNNYLGLADHPDLKEAARAAAERWGTGAGASRLVTGHLPLAAELEEAVARWKGTEAAVVFTSRYAANVGVIPALVGRGDVVFSDRLNHASIVDGIVLSRAHHVRYRHNDVEHLEYLLRKVPREARKLIVTDAVFSMDGD
ncbi:MAG TPA: aminotransferase class I/II-fold pyridoxal phosphate-dependent enzyme, partial [Calditerricola sp.]